ncbi:MAG: hypothetical protein A4E36_00389 [Methanoregulaceae archaeon PtaB.Bin009]|nr:MAG: hypothetical protein A4E36_00389 [Methanoregulaceae archaeon PtaB.Bin009]
MVHATCGAHAHADKRLQMWYLKKNYMILFETHANTIMKMAQIFS